MQELKLRTLQEGLRIGSFPSELSRGQFACYSPERQAYTGSDGAHVRQKQVPLDVGQFPGRDSQRNSLWSKIGRKIIDAVSW
jgi:hypothetical protein